MNIVTGNPSDKSATSTRFVLPFAYELNGKKPENSLLEWKEIQPTTLEDVFWRKQYFTSEVATVLFEKAKWFKLKNNEKDFDCGFEIKNGDKQLQIKMNPPQLVLFQKESKSKFLNTGFLIVEI